MIHDEIHRLRDENAYLTSLIKSFLQTQENIQISTPSHVNQDSSSWSSPAQQSSTKDNSHPQQQQPTILKLKENKNSSRFIVPIFQANKYKEEEERREDSLYQNDGQRTNHFNLDINDDTLQTRHRLIFSQKFPA